MRTRNTTAADHLARICLSFIVIALVSASGGCSATRPPAGAEPIDVRRQGAVGDGKTLDTGAFNRAIASLADSGGGTLYVPAGVYLAHSIHLQSNVTIYLEQGATLKAAPPASRGSDSPTYDPPEASTGAQFQDFGHTHFHNSLLWGEDLHDVAIIGPGIIDGSIGLVRGVGPVGAGFHDDFAQPAAIHKHLSEINTFTNDQGVSTTLPDLDEPPIVSPSTQAYKEYPEDTDDLRSGLGNKAIALLRCRNVLLRDFTIVAGGHFGVLATGVNTLTIDNLKIDTNRDGMDIDCCQNVRISNCAVNSPWDDGICLKSDLALGKPVSCDNVTITNCQVSGYTCGTLVDGTFHPFSGKLHGDQGPTGRIKLGTESNGGFRNIAISNCVFDNCRGLALESDDGALLEDVAVSNLTMRHIVNSPIFLRLGSRLRGPAGTRVGTLQRISISNVVAYDVDPRYASIITGVPGHDVADVSLSHIHLFTRGGGEESETWATTRSAEKAGDYPEPSMFGPTAAYGFFIRHARNITLDDLTLRQGQEDARPPFVLEDVQTPTFINVDAQTESGVPVLAAQNVTGLRTRFCRGMRDEDDTDTTQPAFNNMMP